VLEPLKIRAVKTLMLILAGLIATAYVYVHYQFGLISSADAISLLNNCSVFTQGEYAADAQGNPIQRVRNAVEVGAIVRDNSSIPGFFYCGAKWRYQNASGDSSRAYVSDLTFFHDKNDGSWNLYEFTDENKKRIQVYGHCPKLESR